MPVQINEVIIRAIVGGSNNNAEVNAAPENCGDDSSGNGLGGGAGASDLAEKILEIIREKQER